MTVKPVLIINICDIVYTKHYYAITYTLVKLTGYLLYEMCIFINARVCFATAHTASVNHLV